MMHTGLLALSNAVDALALVFLLTPETPGR